MKIAAYALLALLAQLFLYLCSGSIIMKMRKKHAWSLSGAVLLGFFAYFSVFEVICFICEITLTSLGRLAVIMIAVSGAVMLGGTVYCIGDWIRRLKTLKDRIRQHGFLLAVMIVLTAAVCFFALIYTDASADSDIYVGMASTALFTDSIGRFDPTTGRLLEAINPRYAYALFPYYSAVLADLFRIPAMVASRTVMSVAAALMSCLAFFRLGLCLFGQTEEREAVRKADVFTILLLCLYLFSATIYLPGTFLFSRSFEGKNLIVNVVLPSVLAGCVSVYRAPEEIHSDHFTDLFLTISAGVCFSSSVMIAAILLLAALFPYFLVHRKWKGMIGTICAVLPFLVWMVLYVLNSHRIFILMTAR